MEKFLQQWTIQEMGFHISQSKYNAPVIPESVRTRHSQATPAPHAHRASVFTPKSGNTKSTQQPTQFARLRSVPLAYVCTPGLTSCQPRGSYDRPERRHPSLIRSHVVRGNASIVNTPTRTTASMSSTARSSFQSSYNSSLQNYTRRMPAVRMARTKQTARRVRDDQQWGRARQPEGDRRRDRSDTPPRRARPRSLSPDRLECVFCGLISHQRRNHRRHLILKHNCRPDGTPATAADIEEAKRQDPEPPMGHNVRYKSREFIESNSEDDTTPSASGASTPSDRKSPSPTRSSRQKRTRSESSGSSSPSPQRDTRRVVSRQPAAPSPTTSRAATPSRSAPPVRKQVRKVRFERGTTTVTEGESGTATQKKPVKPPAATTKKPTTNRKDKKGETRRTTKSGNEGRNPTDTVSIYFR